ncbi:MAG: hypothetical protein AAF960_13475 [Bacteroidota bacterium]
MEQFSFSDITFKQIRELVLIEPEHDDRVFEKWFNYPYKVTESDEIFLNQLLVDKRLILDGFTVGELKAKFLIPLLNKVNFIFGGVTDWYGRTIEASVNNTLLNGKTDFLIAGGFSKPTAPYHFVARIFDYSMEANSSQDQLLADLLVALNCNKANEIIGVYVVRSIWRFVLLRRVAPNNYTYFLSSGFNCLNKRHLKRLFIALQGVKADIAQKIKA